MNNVFIKVKLSKICFKTFKILESVIYYKKVNVYPIYSVDNLHLGFNKSMFNK